MEKLQSPLDLSVVTFIMAFLESIAVKFFVQGGNPIL